MTTLTVERFAGLVMDWSKRREQQFRHNWVVNGGWEGWIQVDLAAYMLSAGSAIEVLREQPVYTSDRKRAHLLLNSSLTTDAQIPVEIRAESLENRGAGFVSGVLEDLAKLTEERNADYSSSTCVMLAVPFTAESLARLEDIKFAGHRIFTRIYEGEVACAVAVWTAPDGWLPPAAGLLAGAATAAATQG